jgi:predicted nucleic-acid-binding protein
MRIVDANIVLRYLLNDVEDLSIIASDLLENKDILLKNEVIVEIVYVLEKVYKVERHEIKNALLEIMKYNNLKVDDLEVLKEALMIYADRNLSFVDTILYAYHSVRKYEVYTIDKKLNDLIKA